MLRDVSEWDLVGYGGKGALEKEELRSPEGIDYIIKYPRQFQLGVSWEDITELIAAEIGTILGLEMMSVEIVTRNERRGCLLRNFVKEQNATMSEEGGSLFHGLMDDYQGLLESPLKNLELIDFGFNFMNRFPHWETIKSKFIDMQLFDVLIGNQDRHPFNWKLLYFGPKVKFSPIYDNGASLGFRLGDDQLRKKVSSDQQVNKYMNKTKVKAGLFEEKQVKAKDLITYLSINYTSEFHNSVEKLSAFDLNQYSDYIRNLSVLSEAQREWLLYLIPFRRKKILDWIGKGERHYE